MLRYILRKLLLVIPLLLGVITLIFILIEMSPGSVADRFFTPETTPEVREMIIEKYGLDEPAVVRYFYMVRNLMVLDFGVSMVHERPVFQIVMEALPNTLILSFVTLLVVFPTGVMLGTLQGVKQGTLADTGISVSSLFFYSMPGFWLALMLQLLFSMWWPILPTAGMYDGTMFEVMRPLGWDDLAWWERIQDGFFWWHMQDRATHLILPGLAMGLASAAGTARYMRSSLLEVIRQDYIRTARAKGLAESTIIGKHAVRNAILPIITLVGLSLPFLFSGSVLIETIFAWPGMGRLIVIAIFTQDTPVIIGCFFVFTLVVVAGNLLADLAYAFVDPRIKYD